MKYFKLIGLLLAIFIFQFSKAQTVTLSGFITDISSGESIAKAQIVAKGETVTASNYGFYSILLDTGINEIVISGNGFTTQGLSFALYKDSVYDIKLYPKSAGMKAVEINVKRKYQVKSLEVGNQQVSGATIKKIPAFLGEADVIKAIQLLPGVTTVGEGATGFNVRGGGIDQNLILLDEAPVYNSSHLFGFFSVFNPDAVKEVELMKGGIPANYGGRLSSTLDVRTKEGNNKRFGVEGGVGTIFSRLLVEGPIKKDEASFVIAGRRSYIDVLAKPFLNQDLRNTRFNFYDLTAKVNWKYNTRNRFYISSYLGDDVFADPRFFGVKYGNNTVTARWNHIFSKNLFSNFTYYYSRYRYEIEFKNTETESKFLWKSFILNHSGKMDFSWYANKKNQVSFGAQSIFYNFKPGRAQATTGSDVVELSLPDKYGLENAVYITNDYNAAGKLALRYGLRVSQFAYIGAGTVYEYDDNYCKDLPDGEPRRSRQPVRTWQAKSAELIANYINLEPRFSARYTLNKSSSVKLGYNRMAQNLHLISNTSASVPFDVYQPTTNNIKPEIADQISGGYFKNFYIGKVGFETSAETYYKVLQNQVDYIDGANLLLNENLEGDLLSGDGRAYGMELYLKKATGKLTGWVSYTLARTERKVKGINNFEWYPARYDKLHNLSVTGQYELSDRWEFGANIAYSTGTPTTFYSSQYQIQGYTVPDPGRSRNNVRNPAYFRVDLSATWYRKKTAKYESSWVFSVYNTLNRRNPFSIYFDTDYQWTGQNEAIRYSVIGTIVPAVSYNFKWK